MAGAAPGSAPASNRTLMIVLSYLWLLALVPLLTEKDDPEVQWHAKHGLVLMTAEILAWIVIWTVLAPLGIFGCVAFLFTPIVWVAQFALHVMCVIRGLDGKRLIIPGLSEFADRF